MQSVKLVTVDDLSGQREVTGLAQTGTDTTSAAPLAGILDSPASMGSLALRDSAAGRAAQDMGIIESVTPQPWFDGELQMKQQALAFALQSLGQYGVVLHGIDQSIQLINELRRDSLGSHAEPTLHDACLSGVQEFPTRKSACGLPCPALGRECPKLGQSADDNRTGGGRVACFAEPSEPRSKRPQIRRATVTRQAAGL